MKPVRHAKYKGETSMVTGVCRLSFPSLFETEKDQDKKDTGKYGTTLLIDATDTETLETIEKCVQEAIKKGIATIPAWKGKKPMKFSHPLRDGAEKEFDGYAGTMFIHPKTNRRPVVLTSQKEHIEAGSLLVDELCYPGAYAVASISFFPYNSNGNSGVGCSLSAIQVLKGGERLGGGGVNLDDFDTEEDDEDFDI